MNWLWFSFACVCVLVIWLAWFVSKLISLHLSMYELTIKLATAGFRTSSGRGFVVSPPSEASGEGNESGPAVAAGQDVARSIEGAVGAPHGLKEPLGSAASRYHPGTTAVPNQDRDPASERRDG